MALNKEVFRTRAITAVIFAAVMLAGLFIGAWSFLFLFSVIMIGAFFEYVLLIKKISPDRFWIWIPGGLIYIVLPIILFADLAIRIIVTDNPAYTGILYSPVIPSMIILSIWINDTMAYIVGSMIGKTPFSKISPKKTWEGTAGGAVLAVIVMGMLGYFLHAAAVLPVKDWLVIAAICAIFGTMGDLFESKLKRMAGVKDSGSFMPGHGGFLDRFDSLLWAVPFVWLYLHFFTAQ